MPCTNSRHWRPRGSLRSVLRVAVDLGYRAGAHTLRFLKSRQPDTPNPPFVVVRFLANGQTTDHKTFLRQSAF